MAETRQRARDAVVVADLTHLRQSGELASLVLVRDAQHGEVLVVVALEEGVDAHDDALALVEESLELVGRVGDAALEPVLLDAGDAAFEHGAVTQSLISAKISSASRAISSVSASTNHEPPSGSATWVTLVS